jgi:hypothetical protein
MQIHVIHPCECSKIIYEFLSKSIYPQTESCDRLSYLVVTVPVCRPRGPAFDSRCYQIFCVVLAPERGTLRIVRINEVVLQRKSKGSCLENREYRSCRTAPISANVGIKICRQAAVA